ncbi:MAG: HRDC domain-containing protein, partial [Planctomycetia bacterium]|nr:HRDC domain-containing protein [Planctomycetia bacterium]
KHRVIVHAGREEARMCRHFVGQPPGNLFDLQLAAGLIGLVYPVGHGSLVHQLLGVQLAKGETRTEWRSRPLTRHQVQYAFDDVRFLLPLWEKLHSELSALGRTDWATEEFARLADSTGGNEVEVVEEKWRKLRGLGALGRAQLAGVRELFRWREEQAAQTNKTPRSLLRDDLLVEIARRNPRKDRDLLVIRGLPKRNLPAMLEALERARTLPPEQLPSARPRDNDPPQLGLAANILNAVLGDFCVRRRLAQSLTASSNDLKLLVRSHWLRKPFEADSLLNEGWRKAHILPELQAVLTGQRSIRLGDLQSDAPLVVE